VRTGEAGDFGKGVKGRGGVVKGITELEFGFGKNWSSMDQFKSPINTYGRFRKKLS
jgi:hypothetical protein